MSLSALVLGAAGIALSFLPDELYKLFSAGLPTRVETIVLQLLGALYFAFAMTNWTARANLIGGIYARPVAIGNLCHFTIAALAMMKALLSGATILWIPTLIYSVFALAFAAIFFTHPVKEKS